MKLTIIAVENIFLQEIFLHIPIIFIYYAEFELPYSFISKSFRSCIFQFKNSLEEKSNFNFYFPPLEILSESIQLS